LSPSIFHQDISYTKSSIEIPSRSAIVVSRTSTPSSNHTTIKPSKDPNNLKPATKHAIVGLRTNVPYVENAW
jgi:hypothetical protein